MIEDLMKHLKTTFTIDEELVDELFRSPFFEDFEEINTAFDIKEHKQQATITGPYQMMQHYRLSICEFAHVGLTMTSKITVWISVTLS